MEILPVEPFLMDNPSPFEFDHGGDILIAARLGEVKVGLDQEVMR